MTINIISKDGEANLRNNSFLAWQYIKTKYMDAIILVRHENEYCTFGSDAEIVAHLLNIEPVKDGKERITCRLPHYYTDWLLPKLVKAGYRVALCEPLYFKLKGVS